MYWNHEHATVTDLPAMQNFLIFKYERVQEAITNFTSPLTAIRFVDIIEAHPNLPYDEMEDENFASEGPLFAYNKHAGSRTRAGAATLDAWLLPPQQELELREDTAVGSSCGYDIILSLYKKPIEALQKPDPDRKDHKGGRYKDISMTYKGLYRFFHDATMQPDSNMGLSLRQFRTFFKHMNLQLTVVDIMNKVISDACFRPIRQNKMVNPWHVRVLHHNQHLFLITDGLNSLSKKRAVLSAPLDLNLTDVQTPVEPPSQHYYIGKGDSTVLFIETLEFITSINFNTIKSDYVRIACPMDMMVALYELLTHCKYLPGIDMRGGKITGLRLRIDDKDVIITPPDSAPNDRTVMLVDEQEFGLYHALEKRLARSVINRDCLSSYSDELAQCFREMPRSPLYYGTGYSGSDLYEDDMARAMRLTGRTPTEVTSEHDLSKAYTAGILSMDFIPVYSVFDHFKPYEAGTPFNIYAMYIVHCPEGFSVDRPEFLLLDNTHCLLTGRSASTCSAWPGVIVESVIEPCKLVSTKETHDAIRAIYASDLAMEHKKFLVNKIIGLVARLYNARESTRLFRHEAEARHFKSQHIGSQLLSRKLADGSIIYFVHIERRTTLLDGFYPIQHFISDNLRLQL